MTELNHRKTRCLICNVNLLHLAPHLKKTHKMTLPEYEIKYKLREERLCQLCGRSIEHLHFNVTHCEGHLLIEKKIDEISNSQKHKDDPNYVYCMICRKYVKNLSLHISREHNINKTEYFEIFGNSKMTGDSTITLLSENIKGDKNPGWQHGGTLSPFSKKFIKGDVRTETYKKAQISRDNNPKDQQTKLEHWLHYHTNGNWNLAAYLLKERQAVGRLDKFQERYGEEEGLRRWKERQLKWQNTINSKSTTELEIINKKKFSGGNRTSKFEKCIISTIESILNIQVETQKMIRSTKSKYYLYDLCFENKIIEFNGDYWHCNPEIYSPEYNHKILRMTAKEKWAKDKAKITLANNSGYETLIIWEKNYHSNQHREINRCIDFLTQ